MSGREDYPMLGLATTGELLQELEARFEIGGLADNLAGRACLGARVVIHRLIADLELTPEVLTYRTVDSSSTPSPEGKVTP